LNEALQWCAWRVVLVPRGYHPVAAPRYDLYYLNVMAGPHRRWLVTTDPITAGSWISARLPERSNAE